MQIIFYFTLNFSAQKSFAKKLQSFNKVKINYAFGRAAIPGNSFPSKNINEEPPPVEI